MLGDVTFRKISSLRDFSLVWIENTHRKFSEETEHENGHSQCKSLLGGNDHFCRLADCDMLTFLV